jgi:hypothetical protein
MTYPYEGDLPILPAHLRAIAAGLFSFARALNCNNSFHADRTPRRFTARPLNFIQVTLQPRVPSVMVTLRGMLYEFQEMSELPLAAGRAGAYVVFRITSPHQLVAGCTYIARSYELAIQGRRRFR